MKQIRTSAIFFAVLGMTASSAWAYEQVLTAASRQDPFESAGASARAVGMGTAFVGVADDSAAVLFNPAGLAGLRQGDFSVHHLSGLGGNNQDVAVLALPVKQRFGLGIYAHYVNYGKFEGRSESGEVLPDYRASQLGLGVAGGVRLTGGLTLGLAFRGSQQTLAENSYELFNADAGLLFTTEAGWRLGASYCNLGINNQAEESSAAFRVGASRSFKTGRSFSVLAAAASTLEPKNINRLLIGLEGSFQSMYFLRVGYRMNLRETGLSSFRGVTGGAGLSFKSMRLDYAFEPFAEIGNTHRVSLVYAFGRVKEIAPVVALPTAVPTPVALPVAAVPVPVTVYQPSVPAQVMPEPVDSSTPTAGKSLKVIFDLPTNEMEKGKQLEKEGRSNEAFQIYLQEIRRNKENAQAWRRLGDLYYRYNQKEHAIRCYEEVLRLNPQETALAEWLTKYKAQAPATVQ